MRGRSLILKNGVEVSIELFLVVPLRAVRHRAELVHAEGASPLRDPLLAEQDRSAGRASDRESRDQDRVRHDETEAGKGQIHRSLDHPLRRGKRGRSQREGHPCLPDRFGGEREMS